MTNSLRRIAWLAGALILNACGGGGGGGGGSGLTLTSIAATPAAIPLAAGATQALTVTGTYSNSSTVTLTSGIAYVSDNTAVATVSTAGLVTAVADGTAHITVTDTAAALSAAPVTVTVSAAAAATNTLPVVIDSGPAALLAENPPTSDADVLFATVTICTHGSTTACQTIDHLQVDTGSTGLGIISSVLTGSAVPTVATVNGSPLRECLAYADGYVWGSMATVDVQIGGRTISNLPVNLMGDPAAGAAPASCSTGYTNAQNEGSVDAFGANGVIGVGYFLQDCGTACSTSPAPSQAYYSCPTATTCTPTIVPLDQQLTNPVAALSADNNGVVIVLPAIAPPGAATANGTLYFGIGTQANNALGSAQFLTVVDTGSTAGTLTTVFNGATLSGSVIDLGSSGYFFDDSSIPTCSDFTDYYCPVSNGADTTLQLSATLEGANGVSSAQVFSIGNADSLFANATPLTALPTLGGPNGALNGIIPGFDWGLPFFFGKSVFVLFEASSAAGTTGPAVGF